MAKDVGCWILLTYQIHLLCIIVKLFLNMSVYFNNCQAIVHYHLIFFLYWLATFEDTDVGCGKVAHMLIFLETLLSMKLKIHQEFP